MADILAGNYSPSMYIYLRKNNNVNHIARLSV